jgi:hypothetical protein
LTKPHGLPAIAARRDKVTDVKKSGDRVSWKMNCSGAQAMSVSGTVMFGSTSYSGTPQMSMTNEGQTMQMSQRYRGRRRGECSKSNVR